MGGHLWFLLSLTHTRPRTTAPVAAGIPQRMLLDYLAALRHCKQPQGWSLPAHSWWTDQARAAGAMGLAAWAGSPLISCRHGH